MMTMIMIMSTLTQLLAVETKVELRANRTFLAKERRSRSRETPLRKTR